MRRLLGARFNAEDAEIPQDYTSQGAVLLLRLCNQHPGLVEVVGSQSFSPHRPGPELYPAAPIYRRQRESAGFLNTRCSVLEGCAHPLATQDVLGVENTSPRSRREQEGKLLLSSQKGNGTAVALA